MSTPTNHWKLGLFVVSSLALAAVAAVFFGARSAQSETISYKSFFDESVQGLELGAPVKFRGVTVGSVADIGIADDHRHVEVTSALAVEDLDDLGLSVAKVFGKPTRLSIPPDLRMQLGSSGITGVKFIQIDFFKPETTPPPTLPFPLPDNYIAAAPSMMKNVEDSVINAVEQFPVMMGQLLVVLTRMGDLLGGIEDQNLPIKIRATLAQIDVLIAQVNAAVGILNPILLQAGGDQGLIESLQRTSDAIGGAAQNANRVGPAIEDAIQDVQGAATSIQELSDALKRDPDMLIKGRSKRIPK